MLQSHTEGHAIGVGQTLGTFGQVCHPQDAWVDRSGLIADSGFDPGGVLGVSDHGPPGDLGHRLPGQVVLGRPDTPGEDDGVGTAEGVPDRRDESVEVVPDRHLEMGIESLLGEPGPDESSIGVGDLPDQELGPDCDHFDDQFPGSHRPNFQLGSPGTMVPSNWLATAHLPGPGQGTIAEGQLSRLPLSQSGEHFAIAGDQQASRSAHPSAQALA